MSQELIVPKEDWHHFQKPLSDILRKKVRLESVEQVAEGLNNTGHWVAYCGKDRFGFKTYPMADGNQRVFAEQDKLITNIAQILNIPFVTKMTTLKSFGYNPSQGRAVNVARWLNSR